MIYTSEDGKVMIDLEPHPGALQPTKMTAEEFNALMEKRGCPVRVDFNVDGITALACAWDWLACKLDKQKESEA